VKRYVRFGWRPELFDMDAHQADGTDMHVSQPLVTGIDDLGQFFGHIYIL
jgi:hypothetical protein